MRWYRLALVALLLTGRRGLAQTSFNRWEAQPVATPKPVTSTAKRGAKIGHTKAHQDFLARAQQLRQDSLRIATAAAQTPPLKRGIGQRIKEGQLVTDDSSYFEYLRKTVRYPKEALLAATEGRVVTRLTVGAVGRVINVTVIESTIPEKAVGREAMLRQVDEVLRQIQFEPTAGITTEDLEVSYKYE